MLSFAAYLGSHLVGSNRKSMGEQLDTARIEVLIDFLEKSRIEVDFEFNGDVDVSRYPHLVKTLKEAESVTSITDFLNENHYDYHYSGAPVKKYGTTNCQSKGMEFKRLFVDTAC